MARPHDTRGAFRCSVAPEHSAATLSVGSRRFRVSVLDTSRKGFTVRIPTAQAQRINGKKKMVLDFAGEQWEVALKSRYIDSENATCLGFARLQDLTKIKQTSGWGFSLHTKTATQADPSFLLFLIFAFVVAAMTLPGIGDSLGTAPKVRDAVRSVIGTHK